MPEKTMPEKTIPHPVALWLGWLESVGTWETGVIARALRDYDGGLAPLVWRDEPQELIPCRRLRGLYTGGCVAVGPDYYRGAQRIEHPDLPGCLWLLAWGTDGFSTVVYCSEPTSASLLATVMREAEATATARQMTAVKAHLIPLAGGASELRAIVAAWLYLAYGEGPASAWLAM
jgi:hypothetical protein